MNVSNTIMSFLVFMLFISCQTKKSSLLKNTPSVEKSNMPYKGKASFKLLGKLTGQTYRSYTEYVLVENIHPNPDSARLQEYAYFEENNSICLMEEKIEFFTMNFFRMTDCTEYFIYNEAVYSGYNRKVPWEECEKDTEGVFLYERSKEHPNWWISDIDEKTWGRAYNDTIICNKP